MTKPILVTLLCAALWACGSGTENPRDDGEHMLSDQQQNLEDAKAAAAALEEATQAQHDALEEGRQ